MSAELFLSGRKVESVFQLLGTKENDITYSLGWALAQSSSFRQLFLKRLLPHLQGLNVEQVSLQEHVKDSGITDVELIGHEVHVIIEAKRGWSLPTRAQLHRYAPRFQASESSVSALVAMSECTGEYARLHLPSQIDRVPVFHFSWAEAARLAHLKSGTHAEKRLLSQFRTYLARIATMQKQESNWVYVVSLGANTPSWCKLSWREIVYKSGHYFHPVGDKGWPKEPPNYIGFRFNGKLQSVHHVDSYKIFTDLHMEMPEAHPGQWEPHFFYTLGPAIRPAKVIKMGRIYPSGRVWAMLDLLLTSDSISEARDKSDARLKEIQ